LLSQQTPHAGYNFKDLEEIAPLLEATTAGPTTRWAARAAQRYRAYVTVGYPEKSAALNADGTTVNYNSIVTVAPDGKVLINYRKTFLYYTDETWAAEGDKSFFAGELQGIGQVAQGICMDINPYRFEAPWDTYEFATHVLESQSQLVILSMAWLSRLGAQELTELPLRPDNETLTYWVERFYPLQISSKQPVFVVFANRCGLEGSACYAGTSAILCFRDGRGYIYDILGKWDEQCMIVDLQKVTFPISSH
jgi:protein N-terminal amidase